MINDQGLSHRMARRMRAVVALVLVLITATTATRIATAAVAPRATLTGSVVDGDFVETCDRALGVLARIGKTMSNRDANLIDDRRATAELGRSTSELQAISRSTSDAVLPETLQDVIDAVSAFNTVTADSPRAADLRAVAANAVTGFTKTCPVHNGGFESGLAGWSVIGASIALTPTSHSGAFAARLTSDGKAAVEATLKDAVTTTYRNGYSVALWVRSNSPTSVTLRLTERRSATVVGGTQRSANIDTVWRALTLSYHVVAPGSSLDVVVTETGSAAGASLDIDDVGVVHR